MWWSSLELCESLRPRRDGAKVTRSGYATVIGWNDLGSDVTLTELSDWRRHVNSDLTLLLAGM